MPVQGDIFLLCRFCAVRCVTICFSLLFYNHSPYVFLIFFLCLISCFVNLFSIFCILCCCIVLCTVSPFVYSCLFPTFVQVYGLLAPGGNPIAVSHHITCRDYSLHQETQSKGRSVGQCVLALTPYVALSSHIHILRPYFANKRHLNVALSGS